MRHGISILGEKTRWGGTWYYVVLYREHVPHRAWLRLTLRSARAKGEAEMRRADRREAQ